MASPPLPIQTFLTLLLLSLINTTPFDLTPKTFPSKQIVYQDFSIDSSGAFTVHLTSALLQLNTSFTSTLSSPQM